MLHITFEVAILSFHVKYSLSVSQLAIKLRAIVLVGVTGSCSSVVACASPPYVTTSATD